MLICTIWTNLKYCHGTNLKFGANLLKGCCNIYIHIQPHPMLVRRGGRWVSGMPPLPVAEGNRPEDERKLQDLRYEGRRSRRGSKGLDLDPGRSPRTEGARTRSHKEDGEAYPKEFDGTKSLGEVKPKARRLHGRCRAEKPKRSCCRPDWRRGHGGTGSRAGPCTECWVQL